MASISVRECVQSYISDIQRHLERRNDNADALDYLIFRFDWVITVPHSAPDSAPHSAPHSKPN